MGNCFLHGKGGAVLTGSPVSSGYCYVAYDDTSASTTSLSYVKLKEIKVKFAGIYRVSYLMGSGVPSTFSTFCAIYKNGSIQPSMERENTSSYNLYYSFNINANAGDLIQLYGKHNYSGGNIEIVKEFGVAIQPAIDTSYIAEIQSV